MGVVLIVRVTILYTIHKHRPCYGCMSRDRPHACLNATTVQDSINTNELPLPLRGRLHWQYYVVLISPQVRILEEGTLMLPVQGGSTFTFWGLSSVVHRHIRLRDYPMCLESWTSMLCGLEVYTDMGGCFPGCKQRIVKPKFALVSLKQTTNPATLTRK